MIRVSHCWPRLLVFRPRLLSSTASSWPVRSSLIRSTFSTLSARARRASSGSMASTKRLRSVTSVMRPKMGENASPLSGEGCTARRMRG